MTRFDRLRAAAWLLCALLFCCAHPVKAQTPDTLRKKLIQVFSPIDKSQIPTGFLEEYGLPFIPLDLFNNTLTDSARTNIQAYRYAYATFYSSRIYGSNFLPILDTVNARIATAEKTYATAIPIVLLRADYSILRSDAVSANLLRVQNNQFFDVAGRTQSPYTPKTAFLAAPSRSYSKSGSVSLVIPQRCYFQNNSKAISFLYIDFGGGAGYQTVSWNQLRTYNYTTKGTKRIKVKIKYQDGQILESHFDLEVLNPYCATCRYIVPTQPQGGVGAPVTGVHAGGQIFIALASNHTQLTKPLIVAEGYDTHVVAPNLQEFNYSIDRFFNDIIGPTSPYDFNNVLDNIGNYDIVFIDYNQGTDDIRRNAALFREVVAWVNANKVGGVNGAPNTVLGISMGGLVARYGLAQMVKAGLNPQTNLLITHDSPHQGANTPLGAQALTRQASINVFTAFSTGALVPAIAQANALLDEPASQQMLILRATDATGGVATNTFLNNDYRPTVTFPGIQPPYQIIATSQGSQCGIGSLAPYAELVRSSGLQFFSPIPWIVRQSINSDIVVNALPDNGPSKRISSLRVYAQYRILSFITINIDFINKSYNSPANVLPWDGLAGGTQNVKDQAGSSIPSFYFHPFWWLGLGQRTTLAGDFCFVPTVSALDITTINATTVRAAYVAGGSVSPARVANFIAQEQVSGQSLYNIAHTTFTARNSEWLFNQMEGTTSLLNCSTECNPYSVLSITGSATVCNSTGYSITAQTGVTYQWSVSTNLTITGGQGTASVTVAPNGNGTSTINLNLLRNGCTFPIPGRSVQVGTVTASQLHMTVNSQEIQNLCPSSSYVIQASGPAGTTFDTWTFQGGPFSSASGSGSTANITTSASFTGGSISVIARDACGGSVVLQRTVARSSTCGLMLALFPNPADSYVEASITSADSTDDASQPLPEDYELKIYNKYSQEVKLAKSRQKKHRFDISDLPPDIYYVNLVYKKEILKTQLIISR